MIGNFAQQQVFGNQGLFGSLTGSLLGREWQDALFPKTQLQLAQDRTEFLRHIVEKGVKINSDPGEGTVKEVMQEGLWSTIMGSKEKGTGGLDQILGRLVKIGGNMLWPGANGGIVRGGFKKYAQGGIARSPTMGLIGEGRYNEAVVPLPDGRSIPVTGGGNNVTVNVALDANGNAKATDISGDGARALGYQISQAIQSELVEQQRPGGLLSSY